MNTEKQRWILYLIVLTIITTISVQFYWNYKNYEENKQRVTNKIQLSLDNAVEEYYSSLAKSDFLTIIESKGKKIINNLKFTSDENMPKHKIDSIMRSATKFIRDFNHNIDSLKTKKIATVKNFTQFTDDINGYNVNKNGTKTAIKYFRGKKAADSLKFLTNLKPIFISFLDQSVDYNKIDSLIENQLKKKERQSNKMM